MILKILVNQVIDIIVISLQLVLLLAIYVNHTASADVPQSHCSIATSRVQNGLVLAHPDRFYHARVAARLEKMFDLWRSDIDHMERVICIR